MAASSKRSNVPITLGLSASSFILSLKAAPIGHIRSFENLLRLQKRSVGPSPYKKSGQQLLPALFLFLKPFFEKSHHHGDVIVVAVQSALSRLVGQTLGKRMGILPLPSAYLGTDPVKSGGDRAIRQQYDDILIPERDARALETDASQNACWKARRFGPSLDLTSSAALTTRKADWVSNPASMS